MYPMYANIKTVCTMSTGERALPKHALDTLGTRYECNAQIIVGSQSEHVVIEWDTPVAPKTSKFHHAWLRDNCPCSACIHPSNRQKLHSSADVDLSLSPTSVFLKGTKLHIEWAPGSINHPKSPSNTQAHTTVIDTAWLKSNDPATVTQRRDALLQPTLWDAKQFETKKRDVTYDALMNTPEGLRVAVEELRDYGLLFVRGAPTGDVDVEGIAQRFGVLRNTFYGQSWDVRSVPDAKNIAYTALDLGLHMDLMYFESPPGLQLLHSLKNSVTGGASIFLDSFRAASILKATDPTSYKALTEIPVTFHYINAGQHMHFRRPTIVEGDNNEPLMVYYAPPFQGPLEHEDAGRFYKAFQAFVKVLKEPELMYKTLLRPGDCVIFANRRVLHGREEFDAASGDRHLKGAYVDWDDFKDKLRVVTRGL
ncbi:hypothetical protein HKX48_003613 [Thoreauomyces humboldtii]|nr:hypothetical protein HKX48_003613 [Thoreauomyces humboldtii]